MTSEIGDVLYRCDIRREPDKRVYGNSLHRAWQHTLTLTRRYYCSGIVPGYPATSSIYIYLGKIIYYQTEPRILHNPRLAGYSDWPETLTDPC